MDVKNAFLNGDINAFLNGDFLEEIYMEQPPSFIAYGEKGKICHLRKSLCGLKQSPHAWFDRFYIVVKKFGLTQSTCDYTIFFQHSNPIFLVVYVDDIVIITLQKNIQFVAAKAKGLSRLKPIQSACVTAS